MTPADYFKKWSDNCRIFTDYTPIHNHDDMLRFAKDYSDQETILLQKEKDSQYEKLSLSYTDALFKIDELITEKTTLQKELDEAIKFYKILFEDFRVIKEFSNNELFSINNIAKQMDILQAENTRLREGVKDYLIKNASFKCTCGGFPECICDNTKVKTDLFYMSEIEAALSNLTNPTKD